MTKLFLPLLLLVGGPALAGTCNINVKNSTISDLFELTGVVYSLTKGNFEEVASSANKQDLVAIGNKLVGAGVCDYINEVKYGCSVGLTNIKLVNGAPSKTYSFKLTNLPEGHYGVTGKSGISMEDAAKVRESFSRAGFCDSNFDFPKAQCKIEKGPALWCQSPLDLWDIYGNASVIRKTFDQLSADGSCTFPAYDFTKPYKITASFDDRSQKTFLKVDSAVYSESLMDNDKRDIMDLFNLGEQYRGAVMVSKVDLSGVGSRFAAPNNSEKVTVVFGAMTPQNGYSYWTTNPSWKAYEITLDAYIALLVGNGLKVFNSRGNQCEIHLYGNETDGYAVSLNGATVIRNKLLENALGSIQRIKTIFSGSTCTVN